MMKGQTMISLREEDTKNVSVYWIIVIYVIGDVSTDVNHNDWCLVDRLYR